jgi:PKD repeat protein
MNKLIILFLLACGWVVFTVSSACKGNKDNPCVNKQVSTDFYAEKTTLYPGDWVNFGYNGSDNVTKFIWSFPGSSTPSVTTRFCIVVYGSVGDYTVSLTASNDCSANTKTKEKYIHVIPYPDDKPHKAKGVTVDVRD